MNIFFHRSSGAAERGGRGFDAVMAGIAAVIGLALLCCRGRGYDLNGTGTVGFAVWFLMFLSYLPLEIIGLFGLITGLKVPWINACAASGNQVLVLAVCDWGLLLFVWIAVRLLGRRYGVGFLRAARHIALIILCWGIFQVGCTAALAVWQRGDVSAALESACPSAR